MLIACDYFGALDGAIAGGTKERLAEACFAFLVDLMKVHAFAAGGGKEANGNGEQTEAKGAFPNGMSHIFSPQRIIRRETEGTYTVRTVAQWVKPKMVLTGRV
jgi:hypothetical protein